MSVGYEAVHFAAESMELDTDRPADGLARKRHSDAALAEPIAKAADYGFNIAP
jgi:hypothetical protein